MTTSWETLVDETQANMNITLAIEWFIANPTESVAMVAARLGVSDSGLRYHLNRRGLFVPHDPRRRQRHTVHPVSESLATAAAYTKSNPEESVASVATKFGINAVTLKSHLLRRGYSRRTVKTESRLAREERLVAERLANPTESVKAMAVRLGLSVNTIRAVLKTRLGTSRAKPLAVLRCRICGQTAPEKFHRSSRYSTGYQDKCKACAREYYCTRGGGKDRRRNETPVSDDDRRRQHGTPGKYRRGCRCGFCRRAFLAYCDSRRPKTVEVISHTPTHQTDAVCAGEVMS